MIKAFRLISRYCGDAQKNAFLLDLIRFIIVGIISVLAQFMILVFLVEVAALNPTLSSALGFIGAAFVNYTLLYYWAFRADGKHHLTIMRYLAVMAGTMSINVSLFWVLTEGMEIWYPISQFFATCCSSCFSFLVNRHFTFV